MKKILTLVLTAALAVTALSGCGLRKTDTMTQTQAAAEQTIVAGEAAATGGASTSAGTPKLAVTISDGFTTDDKIPAPWYNRVMTTNLVYGTLFLAGNALTEVTPDLADTYTASGDGLVYTVTLKNGLKWSDGQDLTVDDVWFSIETGLKAIAINSIYTVTFKNIKDTKTDGNTIILTLSEPYAAMLNVLTQFVILLKHSLENTDSLSLESGPFWTNPVTPSMYVLDKLGAGNHFTLKRNENYEGAAPKIDKVICYLVSDCMTAAQVGNTGYVFGNVVGLVGALQGAPSFAAHEVDVLFYKYFIFSIKGIDGDENPTIQSAKARKVIMEAIDRTILAILCPNVSVLNSGVPNSGPVYSGFEYKSDAEEAEANLAASRYDTSRTSKICYCNNDQTSIDLINTAVYCLEQVGSKVEVALSSDGTIDLLTTRAYDIGFKGKSVFSVDEWYTECISSNDLSANILSGDTGSNGLVTDLLKAVNESSRNKVLKKLQDMEQKEVYRVSVFTVGTYIFTSSSATVPSDVEFRNPLYMSGLDFTN